MPLLIILMIIKINESSSIFTNLQRNNAIKTIACVVLLSRCFLFFFLFKFFLFLSKMQAWHDAANALHIWRPVAVGRGAGQRRFVQAAAMAAHQLRRARHDGPGLPGCSLCTPTACVLPHRGFFFCIFFLRMPWTLLALLPI